MTPGKFSSLVHYIQRCRTEIGQIDFRKRASEHNPTREEQDALKSLHNRSDIVIKPADKEGAVVVWDRDLYLGEPNKQLSDERFYQQIKHDTTEMQHKEVITTVSWAISTYELPP